MATRCCAFAQLAGSDRFNCRRSPIGELLPDQEVPLLKSRRERSRTEALKLWTEKRKGGRRLCSPQW